MRTCFLTALLLTGHLAFSQFTEKIETDRPDQTETPFLVPKNYFQAELGMNVERFSPDIQHLVHPTSLLKYGLSNRIEMRLETTVQTEYLHYIPATKSHTALQPVEAGAKIRLFEENGLRPKVSVITHLGLPFLAGKEFHGAAVPYTVRLTLQNTLSERVALGYNVGVEQGIGEPVAYFYTFAPGINIGKRWYAYAEAFGSFDENGSAHNLDGGLAFYLTNNTKLDVSGGFGLADSPLKRYVAVGFSFRLPVGKR